MNICILFPYDLEYRKRKGDFRKNKQAKGVFPCIYRENEKVFSRTLLFPREIFHTAFKHQNFNEHISRFLCTDHIEEEIQKDTHNITSKTSTED